MTTNFAYHCRECEKPLDKFTPQCPFCKAHNCIIQGSPTATSAWVKGKDLQLIEKIVSSKDDRLDTGTRELNRVMGGEGVAVASVNLCAGPPGCGKSTIWLQVLCDLAKPDVITETDEKTNVTKTRAGVCLYIVAEELNKDIKSRADRIAPGAKGMYVLQQPDLDKVEETILKVRPDIMVIDSIQATYRGSIDAPVGSITQIKECIGWIAGVAKALGIATIVICHVTKDDDIAGPKVLEHKVDGVFVFEVDGQIRIMRAQKNRNGPTDEIAMFRMTKEGMKSVENPSTFLLESHLEGVAGNTIATTAQGSRAIMVEIQCLIGKQNPGQPRRNISGLDSKRVNQVVAILSEKLDSFDISDRDLYINVAGGIEVIKDTGTDLPLAIAILSAYTNMAIPEGITSWGEIGLPGEIRPVQFHDNRIKTAEVMKFENIIGPVTSEEKPEGYVEIRSLSDLMEVLWPEPETPKPKKSKKTKKPKKPTKLELIEDKPNGVAE